MIVLFTSRQDWKLKASSFESQYEKVKATLDKTEKELTEQLKAKELSVDTLQQENSTLHTRLDEVKAKLEEGASKKKEMEQQLFEGQSKVAQLDEQINRTNQDLTEAREQLVKARESAELARSNLIDLREMVVFMEKEKGKLRGDIEINEAKIKAQLEELTKKDRILARLEARGIDLEATDEAFGPRGPEVPLNAKIIAVRPEVNIVMLSIGSSDSVKEGYEFTVYSGSTYKGKVQVESIYPNMCSAKIIPGLTAKNQTIEEGDSASTRVY
jgi:predicted  nucleic acid-binding Zn-ribbon protein